MLYKNIFLKKLKLPFIFTCYYINNYPLFRDWEQIWHEWHVLKILGGDIMGHPETGLTVSDPLCLVQQAAASWHTKMWHNLDCELLSL